MTCTATTFTPAMGYVRDLGWFGGYVAADTVCTPDDPGIYAPREELNDSLLHVGFEEACRFSRLLWEDQASNPFTDALLPLWGEQGDLHLIDTRTPGAPDLRGEQAPGDHPERAFALGGFGPSYSALVHWEALVRCPAGAAVGPLDHHVEHRLMSKEDTSTSWEYAQHTHLGDRERALRTAYNLSAQTPPRTRTYRVLREETTLMLAPVDLHARVREDLDPGRGPEPWDEGGVYSVLTHHGVAHQEPEGPRGRPWGFSAYPDFEAARTAHARDETGRARLAYRLLRSTWASTQIGA
ncbi:hypothetical protein ABZ234_08610 [Nocardiopsis sp. NPDC006198]|uniref:hypothetical protein n=1 Tax=Nocardiopsis sp. NPDC006198 TaxID=3154472 RepID=UPI0033B515EF